MEIPDYMDRTKRKTNTVRGQRRVGHFGVIGSPHIEKYENAVKTINKKIMIIPS